MHPLAGGRTPQGASCGMTEYSLDYWAGPRAKELFALKRTPVDEGMAQQMRKASGYPPLPPPGTRIIEVK